MGVPLAAAERLAAMRETWWLGPPPEHFILDRHDGPLGVVCLRLPEDRQRFLLACQRDNFSAFRFGLTFPDELPPSAVPVAVLEHRWGWSPLFWHLAEERDGGLLEDVAYFWPLLEPLPSFSFLSALAEAESHRLMGLLRRRLIEHVMQQPKGAG